jgi:lipoprotein-anchoring transpeptidase ErfK/SrfK
LVLDVENDRTFTDTPANLANAEPSNDTRMKFSLFKPMTRATGLRAARLGIASLAGLLAANNVTDAANSLREQAVQSRPIGEPIMAIVALREQQITVYDANGWILRAPVSSGQPGRETPAGIFSVIQKEAEHYSNMYDDAYMPHMQRLTWSGIAIHGGPLPGYPASHGCVRMPYDFAERLFDKTRLGMRVIVAPGNVTPVAINHPALFQPKAGPGAADELAAATAEADTAASKADQARLAAMTAFRESSAATVAVRRAEILKLKADAQVAAAERAIATAESPEAKEQAENAKAKATSQVVESATQLATAQAELQPKLDAVRAAREAASAAEAARVVATEAVRKATRDLEPISVFISRKTQHLYIRQAFQPILEIPVTIQDPDRPIGTHIFTATESTGTALRWSAVSLVGRYSDTTADDPTGSTRKSHDRDHDAMSTDTGKAKAALDRIVIPQETADRIAEIVSPRSSLIISDEAVSPETSNGTDFVILMSGEPQGGIKHRSRTQQMEVRYQRLPYWRSPTSGSYSAWWR